MKNYYTQFVIIIALFFGFQAKAQSIVIDSIFPIRGFCIAAPEPDRVNEFIDFIKMELVHRKVNTLVLRVDYAYMYESHPELRDSNALSKSEVKKLVAVCKANEIKIIPQINLLGHQSWAGSVNKLLLVV
jgi:hypothetical protein